MVHNLRSTSCFLQNFTKYQFPVDKTFSRALNSRSHKPNGYYDFTGAYWEPGGQCVNELKTNHS